MGRVLTLPRIGLFWYVQKWGAEHVHTPKPSLHTKFLTAPMPTPAALCRHFGPLAKTSFSKNGRVDLNIGQHTCFDTENKKKPTEMLQTLLIRLF